ASGRRACRGRRGIARFLLCAASDSDGTGRPRRILFFPLLLCLCPLGGLGGSSLCLVPIELRQSLGQPLRLHVATRGRTAALPLRRIFISGDLRQGSVTDDRRVEIID